MLVELRNVTFSYASNGSGRVALVGVDLSIETGEFLGIVGPTGSGKSTLVQHLNGLLRPDNGQVFFDGCEVGREISPKELRRDVGVVFQFPESQLFGETVFEDAAFGPRNLKVNGHEVEGRVRAALELVGLDLDLLAERSPFDLSGGEMRKLAIAGVLAMRPRVIVLDEPTAGLDGPGRREVLSHLEYLHRRRGQTVVLVSHDVDEVAGLATRLVCLAEGRIVADGPPAQVLDRIAGDGRGLEPPAPVEFARALEARGLPVHRAPLTVDQAVRGALSGLRNGNQGESGSQ